MIYAKIKDQEELERIQAAMKVTKDKVWYCRLKIIQLSAEKASVQKLSKDFDLCQQSIRNYIHAYNKGGVEALAPKKSPGRPPKIGHWAKEQWNEVLEQTPNQYKKLETQSRQWTLERLQLYLKEYHGIDVCLASVYNSLRKTGRRTGRSKLRVGSPDPNYTVKREYIEGLRDFH